MALAVALSLLADAAFAWLLLFRGLGRSARATAAGAGSAASPITLPALLLVLVAGIGFALLQAAAFVLGFWRPFLAIHLVHSYTFLALPVFGAAVAWGRLRPATRAARITAALGALALVAIGIDSSFIEPHALRTETATVDVDPARAGRADLLVGVVSDLQCTEITDFERDAVARVMAAHPDLILIPGDLAQRFTTEEWLRLAPSMRELLGTLHAPLGVYSVAGNCDPPEIARALVLGTDVQFLRDESVQRTWRDRRVTITGTELDVASQAAHAALRAAAAPGGDDLRIVFAHRPDVALELPPGGRVDLVVAGHTHGGQVRLPWIGPLITLTSVPRDVAGGGLHQLNGSPIYVSRGIGHEQGDAPCVRFLCPPEVSLITLHTRGAATAAR